MNLRPPTIAFVEDNRDLRDLEFARSPDAIGGFYLEQIPDGEHSVQPYALECATPPAFEAAGKVRVRHSRDQPGVSACGLAEEQSLEIPIHHIDPGQITRAQRQVGMLDRL